MIKLPVVTALQGSVVFKHFSSHNHVWFLEDVLMTLIRKTYDSKPEK